MPFIGQQPTTGAFLELDSLSASATADYTLQLNGANYEPESVNNLLVSINGVIQGSSTMSLSGSTLTVGATLSSSDVIDEHDTVTPPSMSPLYNSSKPFLSGIPHI